MAATLEDVTADFVYVRLHGDERALRQRLRDARARRWAARIARWRATRRDVYVYFDNDVKVRAPFDAMNLAARVAGRSIDRVHPGRGGEPARTNWPAIRTHQRSRKKPNRCWPTLRIWISSEPSVIR